MLRRTALALLAAVCLAPSVEAKSNLSGSVRIDGSSTVYPITEAVAEEFFYEGHRNVRVTVGFSGTGGGFKKFAAGETDISDASRPIKPTEYDKLRAAGIEFIELPIAYDGLCVVVNPENDWVDSLTVDELKMIFLDGSTVDSWNDVRSSWPDAPLEIYAPGTDSGTFDYFKEVIAGKNDSIRGDMSVSEDDNILVRGVAGNKGAIGFFGIAYFEENQNKLRAVPIVPIGGDEPVMPSPETVESGEYAPFSRPLFIYVAAESAKEDQVAAFVDFYLDNAQELAADVGYVGLPNHLMMKVKRVWDNRETGTRYLTSSGEKIHKPLSELY
jgi:phosphate transport system substrate-binding protein